MTKEQFLQIIQQKGRGKYIAILDEFVNDKRAAYGTRELYNLLIYEFDLTKDETNLFSYYGFNGALKKYKKQLGKEKGSRQGAAEGANPELGDNNTEKRAWEFQDADVLAATHRFNKYKNL